MLFKSFEVFIQKFQSADVSVFVFDQLEQNILPLLNDDKYLFAHLQFLFRSICNIFDFIFIVEQFQVPDGYD